MAIKPSRQKIYRETISLGSRAYDWRQIVVGANGIFNLISHCWIFQQEYFGILASLTQQTVVVTEERTFFIDNAQFHAKVHDFADFTDAVFKEHDVKFAFAERSGHFI